MKRFLVNIMYFALIGSIPLLILLVGYFVYDPFKVVYPYSNYSYPYVISNRDYISTEMFGHNYKKYNYNSFVFGSSRTLAFKPNSWKNYLSKSDQPFMFDASGESIYGIYTKLKYLDAIHANIDNALILICRDATFNNSTNHKGHLFIKHPITSKESKINFHLCFIQSYLSPNFLFSFYSYTFSKQFKPFMVRYIENRKIVFDTLTNEVSIIDQEDEITNNTNEYYKRRENLFYQRLKERSDSIVRIKPEYLFLLKEVKRILVKNHTNYKIIISPLYEQIKLNPNDLSVLKNIFNDRLYDFSGKNSFTNSSTNYYETSHFRPLIGDSILKIIYDKPPTVHFRSNI